MEVGPRAQIDTVVLAFTDMQGRLQGKRLAAEFFLDEVAEHFSEGCNYLLAVDVDMNTVGGYAMSSWETGYGDFVLKPDLTTMRQDSVAPGHGPGHRRPHLARRLPRGRLAQADPAGAGGQAGRARPGRRWKPGRSSSSSPTTHSFEDAAAKGYRDLAPANQYNVDYSILWTSRVEPLGCAGSRNGNGFSAGMYVESAKGECNLGQHEIAFRYAGVVATCDNHSIYKTGAKEIAAQDGMSLTFMAKPNAREGNSCHIHLSVRDGDGNPVLAGDRVHGLSRTCASTSWPASWPPCAS